MNAPREKPQATAFDALAAALAPALIIGMIGSLVCFLVIAFYRGQYDVRLMYILGLYTAATVLIARIAIESGRAHAAKFAAPLGIVAALAMFRFVTLSGDWAALSGVINLGLLALAWYLADRITFDCTLLEEDRESLQGGLLQTLGSRQSPSKQPLTQQTVARVKQPLGQTALKKARHNPGVWVLYFALIAFPLFGLGQLAIPDPQQRGFAFWLLVSYLACALGLLMTTSLLGLRRYLRQRGASMTGDITSGWLLTGTALVMGVLLLSWLLPLPGQVVRIAGVPLQFRAPDGLQPLRWGWGNDGPNQTNPSDSAPQSTQADPANHTDASSPAEASNNAEPSSKVEPSHLVDPSSKSDSSRSAGSSQKTQPLDRSDQAAPSQSARSTQPDAQSQPGSQPPSGNQSQSGKQTQPDRAQSNQTRPESDERPIQQPTADNQTNRGEPNTPAKPAQNAKGQREALPDQGAEPEPSAQRDQRVASEESAQQPLRAGDSLSSASKNLAANLSGWLSGINDLFKWLLIALLVAFVLFYALTHPAEMLRLWRDLLAFINLLLGRKADSQTVDARGTVATSAPQGRLPFASFANPFRQNLKGWSTVAVIEHTFAALEAWSAERGLTRPVDQTAEEFARQLARLQPSLANLPVHASSMLDRVMFGGWKPGPHDLRPLEELWRALERSDV